MDSFWLFFVQKPTNISPLSKSKGCQKQHKRLIIHRYLYKELIFTCLVLRIDQFVKRKLG